MINLIYALVLGGAFVTALISNNSFLFSIVSWAVTYMSYLYKTFHKVRKMFNWLKIYFGKSKPLSWDVTIKFDGDYEHVLKAFEKFDRILEVRQESEIKKNSETIVFTSNKVGTLVFEKTVSDILPIQSKIVLKKMEHHFYTARDTLKILKEILEELNRDESLQITMIVTLYSNTFEDTLKNLFGIKNLELKSANVVTEIGNTKMHITRKSIEFTQKYIHDYDMKLITDLFLQISTSGVIK